MAKGVAVLREVSRVVQVIRPLFGNDSILGAVGVLQFDVTMAHVKPEYGVEVSYEPIEYAAAYWISCADKNRLTEFEKKCQMNLSLDANVI